MAVPVVIASTSPFLAWREPIYIGAGFAGIIALALLLVQPLLAAGWLPGVPARRSKRLHQWLGGALVVAVLMHVGGLWVTSPPDVVDALLFASPTPFSVWGVVAMWALFGALLLALLRRKLKLKPLIWRQAHTVLVVVVVIGTVTHALLIEGAMEVVSKTVLCVLVLLALIKALFELRSWMLIKRPRV
ncbi:MAG: ferric reductase-like transmembrane domain-containing protein [Pseudomonadota bacterium]